MKTTPVFSPVVDWKLASGAALMGACMIAVGCGTYDVPPGQGGPGQAVPPAPYTITVNSTDPTTAVPITVSPADSTGTTSGNSSFTLTYGSATTVTLTAQPTNGLEVFKMWQGCTASVGATCTVTSTSDLTVNAVYEPKISFTLQPQNGCCAPPYYVPLGTGESIYTNITTLFGESNQMLTWALAGPTGYDCSNGACGALSVSNGNEFYQAPTDAGPAYVTITATSVYDPVSTASVVLTLGAFLGSSGTGGVQAAVIPRMLAWENPQSPGMEATLSVGSRSGGEGLSGAVAEAESLALSGWQGLAPNRPAFNLFVNYDGAGSKFGEGAPETNASITGGVDFNGKAVPAYLGGDQMAVYATKRSSDGAITVLVFNKSQQDLTSTVTLGTKATAALVYQMIRTESALKSQPTIAVTGGAATTTFPAQSVTLLVFAN